jgi:hypothetical protein
LGRIIRVTDDVVDYRRWIERNFPMPLGSVCSDLSISNVEVSTASLNNASNAKSSPPGERKAHKSRV